MPKAQERLHAALAEDASKLQSAFTDAFDALYAGVVLTAGPMLAFLSDLPAPTLGHGIVFFCGVALLVYGWRQGVRNDMRPLRRHRNAYGAGISGFTRTASVRQEPLERVLQRLDACGPRA
jgi:hypothetical protein